jgi:LPS O-antigen subunit length determinant protein (WzzB/FepE family)
MTEKIDQQNLQIPLSYPDEINLLEYIYVLVKNKWWIIGAAFFGLVLGYVAAMIKGPTYVVEAVIAAKENDTQKTPNLSGLGALTGMVASQLNLAGSPGLDKMTLLLGSRKFYAEYIKEYDLLPLIYKYEFDKIYNQNFDTINQKWKPEFVKPNLLSTGDFLKNNVFKNAINKDDNTLTVTVSTPDSTFSDSLISTCLQFLNSKLRANIQNLADEKIAFLENRLAVITDPLLREKIQGLIANEIEKTMLISKESFNEVDSKYMKKHFKQKKIYPIALSFFCSIMVIFILFVRHLLSSKIKNEEDIIYLAKIKRDIFTIV